MAIEAVKSTTHAVQSYQTITAKAPAATKAETQPVKAASDAPKIQLENISIDDANTDAQIASQNEQIKKAVADLNKQMSDTSCQFVINDTTNRVTIKIIDNNTKEVIKEYPAEETMRMIEKAWELAGIMVDEKL